jgi:hypothetical protein
MLQSYKALLLSTISMILIGCGSGANNSNNLNEQNDSSNKVTYLKESSLEVLDEKPKLVNEKNSIEDKPIIEKIEADTTAPIITLLGKSVVTITEGEDYIDEGATAIDEKDGKLKVSIISNNLNTKVAGTYHIVYSSKDSAGNIAQELTRTIIVEKKPNSVPVAKDQNITLDEDTTKTITLVGNDIDNDKLSYIVIDQPSYGSLSGSEENLTYRPNIDFYGVDSFTYKVNDSHVDSNIATVHITVNDVAEPAYQCPANEQTEANFEDRFIIDSFEDRDFNATAIESITVEKIEEEFNIARKADPTINKMLVMPSQAEWDMFTDSQKALYLINSERCARGIRIFEGIDTALILSPAQTYADYLKENNAWGHEEDGRTPWERLEQDANVKIGTNADFFKYGENLASIAYGSTGDYLKVSEPVALSVYGWLYNDKDDTKGSYGHRKFLLATGLKENFGDNNKEGLIGVGVATLQYEKDGFYWTKVYTVLNAFDPNDKWENGSNIIKVDIEPSK